MFFFRNPIFQNFRHFQREQTGSHLRKESFDAYQPANDIICRIIPFQKPIL